jgi:hypothetical protein
MEASVWGPGRQGADSVAALFKRLVGLNAWDFVASQEQHIPCLRFDDKAQRIWNAWRDQLETRLRSAEMVDTPAFMAHLAKYRSLVPSLALLSRLIALVANMTAQQVLSVSAVRSSRVSERSLVSVN